MVNRRRSVALLESRQNTGASAQYACPQGAINAIDWEKLVTTWFRMRRLRALRRVLLRATRIVLESALELPSGTTTR